MTGTETVTAHVPCMPEAGTPCCLLDDVRNRSRIKTAAARDEAITIHAAEDRATHNLCLLEPRFECPDGADAFVFGVRNPDFAADALLIRLAPAKRADNVFAAELQVLNLEAGGFGTTKCAGEGKQEERLVAGAREVLRASSDKMTDVLGKKCCFLVLRGSQRALDAA